jgi:Tol biopolymer transport system component
MGLASGERLGPYEVQALIGAGGMGEVYRALDPKLDRLVAIKVLPERLGTDRVALERFEREAKTVAALAHPNILSIYDLGGTTAGRTYAVMELLEGETLRERLAEGPLPPRKAAIIGGQIARGLGAAHEKGVVHRDLKPENVFITREGRTKILDFGLAIVVERAESSPTTTRAETRTSLTSPGSVIGTVSYMSPEQVRGGSVDARSDIFAFGSLLYEMLTGQRAFARETSAETMTAILREEPAEPAAMSGETIPPALLRVVRRCLEKRPEERFQSARDLGFAVENSMESSGVTSGAHPAAAVDGMASRAGGRGALIAAGLLGAIALGGMVGALLGYRAGTDRAGAAEPVRVRRLTVSGADRDPTASPDGRVIAFTSERDGIPRIWLKQLAGGGEGPLTEGPDNVPRFSPDGSSILFVRDEGGMLSLYRQALVGGTARRLVADAGEGEMAPDGERVAFIRVLEDGLATSAIGVAGAREGGGELIYRTERLLYGVRWSPDGTAIAAVASGIAGNAPDNRVVLLDAESGELLDEESDALSTPLSSPVWTAGGSLVFARAGTLVGDQGEPTSRVVRREPRSGREVVLFHEENLFPILGLRAHATTIDVLGQGRLVLHQTEVGQHLYQVAAPGTIGPLTLTRGEGRDRQPTHAPDGRRVLFASNRSGNLDLWMVDRDGMVLRQITDDEAQDWDPAYAADGRRIAWSSDRGGHLEIWVADANGTGARQVSDDGQGAENPSFTPDGEWIVYASANPAKRGVWIVRSGGGSARQIASGAFLTPEVSPDGRFVSAVQRDLDETRTTIRVFELATGRVVPFEIVVTAPARAPGIVLGRSRWLPDGSAIAFVGFDEQGRAGVFAQDFVPGEDTAATRRPLAGFHDDLVTESFGLAPDGSSVTIAGVRRTSRILLAEGVPGVARP